MKTISYPFSIDTRGKVAVSEDPRKIWQDRVRAVVNTQVGDRVMRPGFGSKTEESVMNLGTPAAGELVQNIKAAFINWLPALGVQNINTSMDSSNAVLTVDIWFTLPSGALTNTSVTFDAGRVTSETEVLA